jgi:hypothetical protein
MIIYEENLKVMRDSKGFFCVDARLLSDFISYVDKDFDLKWYDRSNNEDEFDGVLLLAFTKFVPPLKPVRQWHAIRHQHGGYGCHHIEMIATRLVPRPEVLPVLKSIAREGCGAEGGRFDQDNLLASRLISYASMLNEVGLNCECSWRHLSESLYPIDATQENLQRIAEDAPELDDLADWTHMDFLRARYSPSLAIFYIVENSD